MELWLYFDFESRTDRIKLSLVGFTALTVNLPLQFTAKTAEQNATGFWLKNEGHVLGFDWSDIADKVSFTSATKTLNIAVSGYFNLDPYVVGTSSTLYAISWPFQRKVFYSTVDSQYYVFYGNGSHMILANSSAMSTWTLTAVRTATDGTGFSVATNNSHFAYAYASGVAAESLIYRLGIINANGTVTWGGEVNVDTPPATYAFSVPSIIFDANQKNWITAINGSGTTKIIKAYGNGWNNGSWLSAVNYILSSVSDNGEVCLASLSDSVIFTYDNQTIYTRYMRNDEALGMTNTASDDIAAGDEGSSGTFYFGVKVYRHPTSGADVEITSGVSAIGSLGTGATGYTASTKEYSFPAVPTMAATDRLIVQYFGDRAVNPPTSWRANFTSDQLDVTSMAATTWRVKYWISRTRDGPPYYYYWDFAYGGSVHDAKITYFQPIAKVASRVYNLTLSTWGNALDLSGLMGLYQAQAVGMFSLCASGAVADYVFTLQDLTAPTSASLYHYHYTSGVWTFIANVTKYELTSAPVLSLNTVNNDLYVFYVKNYTSENVHRLHWRNYTSSSWTSEYTLYTGSNTAAAGMGLFNALNCYPTITNNAVAVIWLEGIAYPYSIFFDTLAISAGAPATLHDLWLWFNVATRQTNNLWLWFNLNTMQTHNLWLTFDLNTRSLMNLWLVFDLASSGLHSLWLTFTLGPKDLSFLIIAILFLSGLVGGLMFLAYRKRDE